MMDWRWRGRRLPRLLSLLALGLGLVGGRCASAGRIVGRTVGGYKSSCLRRGRRFLRDDGDTLRTQCRLGPSGLPSSRICRARRDTDGVEAEEAEKERARIRKEREMAFQRTPGAIVEWSAVNGVSKTIAYNGREGRSPENYLALPPENYSVLSSKSISRTDPGKFKAQFGPLNFFGNQVMVEMLSAVKVDSVNKTAMIEVYDCSVSGSPAADMVKGTFQTECHTKLTCFEKDGSWNFRGDYDLRVRVKPQAYGFKTKWRMGILRRVGNAILRPSVKIAMKQFLEYLAKDYQMWASGSNEARESVTDSEIGIT